MNPDALDATLDRLVGRRIAVIGDLMLDAFVSGTVERLSPETSVPVVSDLTTTESPGGAANVARGLQALGAQVILLGVTGVDPAGDRLADLLAATGIDVRLMRRDPTRPTTQKTRIIADGRDVVRIDSERRDPMSGDVSRAIAADVAGLDDIDAIAVSDYGKGVVDDRVMEAAIRAGHRATVPVLVDPTHTDPRRYRGSTILKANAAELVSLSGTVEQGDATAWAVDAATDLLAAVDVESIIVTLGRHGMVLTGRDSEPLMAPTEPLEECDVSGAGDTVMAVVSLCAAAGVSAAVACELANLAAGVAVSRRGVSVVTALDVARSARRRTSAPVVDLNQLLADVATWRAAGERIVFTNGCFDVLHEGHRHLLRRAGELGDRLIVAVDDDASVARLKGEGRPVMSEAARADALTGDSCVDRVTIFRTDDLVDIVTAIAPDVLVKGDDYRMEDVVGATEVHEAGGSVELVARLGGHSTTASIAAAPGRSDGAEAT